MNNQDELKRLWEKAARRLCRRVNFGWWYEEVTLPLVGLAFLGGIAVLIGRRYEWDPGSGYWGTVAILVGLVFLYSWWRTRGKWLTKEEAFVRMEAALGLHNAMTTALAGHGPWPEFSKQRPVVRWRWGQLAMPVVSAFVLFILGFVVPMVPAEQVVPENQPYSWSRLEAEVEALVKEDLIQEDYAEEIKRRLEELREQKADDWFSAASLEATDTLQQAHIREMSRLQRDLMQVEQALRKAADPKTTDEQRQKLQQQFEEAMEGMRNGQMKPNEDLLKKLGEAAEKGLKGMSDGEQQELQKRLRGLADQLGERQDEELDGEPGEGGPKPGRGGPKRGPGAGGDLFGGESPRLEPKKFEHLEGREEQEPRPGDLLNLEEIEHDLDPSKKEATTSGSAAGEGLGGDRVWKDALDPDEQKSLKSFFE